MSENYPELIEIFPSNAIFFDDYPLTKLSAEVIIRNKSSEKIVFRVNSH